MVKQLRDTDNDDGWALFFGWQEGSEDPAVQPLAIVAGMFIDSCLGSLVVCRSGDISGNGCCPDMYSSLRLRSFDSCVN